MSSLEQLTRGGPQAWRLDVGNKSCTLYIHKRVLFMRFYSGNWFGYALFKRNKHVEEHKNIP